MSELSVTALKLIEAATSTDGAGTASRRCGGCERPITDWRTDLFLNPRWLDDPSHPAVLCQQCLSPEPANG